MLYPSNPSIRFPYLLLLASLLMPLFGFFNAFDIFYFGLLKSDAFAFVSGYVTTSLCTFILNLYKTHWFRRFVIALLFLVILVTLSNSTREIFSTHDLLIEPTIGRGIERKQDIPIDQPDQVVEFLIISWFFGSLVGFGSGIWIKKLECTIWPKWLSRTIPILVGFLVSVAGINMFLLGNLYFTFSLIFIVIFIVTGVTANLNRNK